MGRNYDGQGSDKGDATQVIRPRPFLAGTGAAAGGVWPFLAGTGAAAGEVLLAGSRAPPHVTAAAIRHCGPNAARPLRTRVLRKDQLTFVGWLPSMPDLDSLFPSKTDSSTYQPKFKIFCFAGEDSFFSPRSHPQCNRHPDAAACRAHTQACCCGQNEPGNGGRDAGTRRTSAAVYDSLACSLRQAGLPSEHRPIGPSPAGPADSRHRSRRDGAGRYCERANTNGLCWGRMAVEVVMLLEGRIP